MDTRARDEIKSVMKQHKQQTVIISSGDKEIMNEHVFDNVPDTASHDAVFTIKQKDNTITVRIGGKRETLLWILIYCFLHKHLRAWFLPLFTEAVVYVNKIPFERITTWMKKTDREF